MYRHKLHHIIFWMSRNILKLISYFVVYNAVLANIYLIILIFCIHFLGWGQYLFQFSFQFFIKLIQRETILFYLCVITVIFFFSLFPSFMIYFSNTGNSPMLFYNLLKNIYSKIFFFCHQNENFHTSSARFTQQFLH